MQQQQQKSYISIKAKEEISRQTWPRQGVAKGAKGDQIKRHHFAVKRLMKSEAIKLGFDLWLDGWK